MKIYQMSSLTQDWSSSLEICQAANTRSNKTACYKFYVGRETLMTLV
jgi:hypothetical protein